VTYDLGKGEPSISYTGETADLENQVISTAHNIGESSGPDYLRDHLSAFKLDVSREIAGSFLTSIDFGTRMSDRGKRNETHFYYLCPEVGSSLDWCSSSTTYTLPSDKLEVYKAKGIALPDMVYGTFDDLAGDLYGNVGDIDGSLVKNETWHIQENSYEGYIKANFASTFAGIPVEGNVGMRVVGTFSKSSGWTTDDEGATYTPSVVSKSYADVLPSMSLNFHLTDDQILRFGAAFAMSRPPLDELRVANTLSTNSGTTGSNYLTGTRGNPTLNPYRSKQVDLSYEWYFHEESILAAAVYYKHLNSFIGYKSGNETYNDEVYYMSYPVNGKGGDVTGMEFSLQSRFYFIPVAFLQDFGIYANYAYVNSGVKEYTPVTDPLDAAGFAKHTMEVDLWYSAHGIEGRLAYKLHSPYTLAFTWDPSALSSSDWGSNLDASLSYQINENLNIRFQAHNITNEVWRSYYDNNPQETARYDLYKRTFMVDLSFHN
jgi:iron complex outermembrane recepter protein